METPVCLCFKWKDELVYICFVWKQQSVYICVLYGNTGLFIDLKTICELTGERKVLKVGPTKLLLLPAKYLNY